MADVLQKIISDKDFVNGACITTSTPLYNPTKNRLPHKINDNTGIASISGVLDTRFDDSTYYSGDAAGSGGDGGGESSLPSIRSKSDTTDLPTGTVDGDLVIIMAMDSHNSPNTITVPAGFSTVFNAGISYGSYGRPFAVFYKVASSEPSSYTISDATEVSIITVKDCGETPVHATDTGNVESHETEYTFTPLTISVDNCLILYIITANNDLRDVVVSSGPATEEIYRFATAGHDRMFAVFSMDELQDIGYSDDVEIGGRVHGYPGRFIKMAIRP